MTKARSNSPTASKTVLNNLALGFTLQRKNNCQRQLKYNQIQLTIFDEGIDLVAFFIQKSTNLSLLRFARIRNNELAHLSTVKRTSYTVTAEINPILGHKPICLITTMDVQKMYSKIRKEGRVYEHPELGHQLKGSTVRRIHNMLHHAMKTAVQARLIAKNPTEGTTVPKNNYPPKTVLNDDQLERFMEEISKDPIWFDFFYTEITTGMRRGEICALQWDDFDSERGTLKVRRSFSKDHNNKLIIGDTKTFTGNRTIYLPPSTVSVLRERQKNALTEWIFHNPVFPEDAVKPDAAYRRLKQILAEADLPDIRFHDLRHPHVKHTTKNKATVFQNSPYATT